jgi:hypothetical protein
MNVKNHYFLLCYQCIQNFWAHQSEKKNDKFNKIIINRKQTHRFFHYFV